MTKETSSEKWTWTKFGNRFEVRCDGSICIDYPTQAEAEAHVARALRTNAERDAKLAIANPLFNKANWKLQTYRPTVATETEARHIAEALSFFCGGAEVRQLQSGNFSVGSLGYYHYCGA